LVRVNLDRKRTSLDAAILKAVGRSGV